MFSTEEESKYIKKLKENKINIEDIPLELFGDSNFLKQIITFKPNVFRYISEEVQEDEELIKFFLNLDGYNLYYLNDKIKNNFDFVKQAIISNPLAFSFASKRLQNNKELALLSVSKYGVCLEDASDKLKKDIDVVIAAVQQETSAIYFSSFWIGKLKNKKIIDDGQNNIDSQKLIDWLLSEKNKKILNSQLEKNKKKRKIKI